MAQLRLLGAAKIKKNLEILQRIGFDGNFLYAALGRSVGPLMQQARANAAQISDEVARSVYLAEKPPPSRPRKKTVLVVVHKEDTMRAWRPGQGNTSPRAKVIPASVNKKGLLLRGNRDRNLVAESLATMLEIGTTRRWRNGPGIQAHLWFKRAIEATRSTVSENVKTAVREAVEVASAQFV